MKKRLLPAVAATVITAMCLPAHAFEITFSGFANVIGGFTNASQVDTVSYLKGWGGVAAQKGGDLSTAATKMAVAKGTMDTLCAGGSSSQCTLATTAYGQTVTDVVTATGAMVVGLSAYTPLITQGNMPRYHYYKDKINFTDPTNIGLQAKGDINDKLAVTLQMVSHGSDNFNTNAAWAFVTYLPSDNWMIRAGRIRNPIFMLSENLEVGYTYPWVETPQDVYGQVRVANLEGFVATYNNTLGESWDYNVSFFGGTTHTKLDYSGEQIETRLNNGLGFNFEIGNEELRLRAGVAMTKFSMDKNPRTSDGLKDVLDGWAKLQTSLITQSTAGTAYDNKLSQLKTGIAEYYDEVNSTIDRFGSFLGLGYSYDKGNFISMGEYTERTTASKLLQSTAGWYVMFGYRMGSFLPHFTYSGNRTRDDSKRKLIDVNLLNSLASGSALLTTINSTFADAFNKDFAGANYRSDTFTTGLRWNVMPAAALKAEYAYVVSRAHTQGGFDIDPKKNVSMYKLALEAVF